MPAASNGALLPAAARPLQEDAGRKRGKGMAAEKENRVKQRAGDDRRGE